jgi:hypothetical protein
MSGQLPDSGSLIIGLPEIGVLGANAGYVMLAKP